MNLVEKARAFLSKRSLAYRGIFKTDTLAGQIVLADLAKFCRATETTFHPDPRVHSLLEGRREVLLRIQNHLNLSDDELWRIYGRKDLTNE